MSIGLEKRIKLRTALFVVLVSIIISSSIAYSFAQPTLVFNSWTASTECTYLIQRSGSTYYAREGVSGLVTSGSNATALINSVLASNVHIFLKAAEYVINGEITKAGANNVLIEGEPGTVLKLSNSRFINIIHVPEGFHNWTIRGIEIDGNRDHNTWLGGLWNQNGIMVGSDSSVGSGYDLTIEKCSIHDVAGNLIVVRGSNIFRVNILDNYLAESWRFGIIVTLSNDVIISRNHIFRVGADNSIADKWHSIYTYGNNHVISDNVIVDSGGDGIEVYGLFGGTITGNLIVRAGRIGIYVQEGGVLIPTQITVSANTIMGSGCNPNSTWLDGIRIVQPNTIVSNNIIKDAAGNGIYAADYSVRCTITGNNIENSTQEGINCFLNYYTVVSGNFIRCLGSNGLLLNGASFISATGNVIEGIGGYYGIVMDSAENCVVDGNTVINGYGLLHYSGSGYNILSNNGIYGTEGIMMYQAEGICTSRVVDSFNGTTWVSSWGLG